MVNARTDSGFISVEDLARMKNISSQSIRKKINDGSLEVYLIGKQYAFKEEYARSLLLNNNRGRVRKVKLNENGEENAKENDSKIKESGNFETKSE